MTFNFLVGLVTLYVGLSIGRIGAHNTVATECERLGAFYVGKNIYECQLKVAVAKP